MNLIILKSELNFSHKKLEIKQNIVINKAETYRSYKRALQVLVFNILNSHIFSLRQFEDVLFSVDNFHGSIWQPFSNVTCNGFSKPSKTHGIYRQTTNFNNLRF